MTNARNTFNEMIEEGHDANAAAMVALAEAIESLRTIHSADLLSHGLALGIRKGLFGSGSEDSADIRELNFRD